MKLKYILQALVAQGPFKRFIRNFFITGNAWGMFSKYSHITKTNTPKIGYSTHDKAKLTATKMQTKTGFHYSVYRCIFCGKFHNGKNGTMAELVKALD